MDEPKVCLVCQDFESNVGHEWKWCPNNMCKKCGQKGHTKFTCMFGLENLPLPNEILFQIINHLTVKDLAHFSQVSKRVREICQDKLMHYCEYLATIDELNSLIGNKASQSILFGQNNRFLAKPMPKVKDWQRIAVITDVRNHIVRRW